ncbi:SPOR domain-containing protein [Peptostreptococcus equinus]|uniref:SPOR domain-containing protein n=1 Tax=Peptostreptococcus equinus TaxID=3003601 RepID=A0ABY7JRU6_9FIRM|nr:SPOR domain-containing protein [Peptostreptococcus sp. CBA3647]WAW15576.1 SPOR domain-containing protein [Peptostreptococcus sp. CBA3647]
MNNKIGRELISLAVSEADEKYINRKYEINSELNKGLKVKYERVGKDEEKYIEILRYNIIFYKSIIKKLESILDLWIQNDVIFNTESIEKNINNITNSSREYVNKAMKNGNEYLNDKDKKIFLSYDRTSGLKRIEKIENDYKILNLYKDILAMVISVISSDVLKFSPILEMSTESAKIDVMNEIFKKINEILFTTESPTVEFKDQALVDDENMQLDSLVDEEKCNSFLKYVAMISAPEISVKINDVFRDCTKIEEIEEDAAYKFPEPRKEYISCVALLMDYITPSKKKMFMNAFRMYVVGLISPNQFEALIERLIRNHTFIDKSTWVNSQRVVNAAFNMENSKFFGQRYLEDSTEDLNVTQSLNIVETNESDSPIKSLFEKNKERDIDNQENHKFGKSVLSKFTGFTDKFRTPDDESYESYENNDYEDDDYDYDSRKSGVASKLSGFFKLNKDKDDYEDDDYDEFEEYDDDEKFDSYKEFENTLIKNIKTGDNAIQDENAIAILKLREQSRKQEIENLRREISSLKKERALAEKISKHGMSAFKDNPELEYSEEDYAYVKRSSMSQRESDLFDDTIEGQISIFELENLESPVDSYIGEENKITDIEKIENEMDQIDSENDMFKPILGRTQRLNLEAIKNHGLKNKKNNSSTDNIRINYENDNKSIVQNPLDDHINKDDKKNNIDNTDSINIRSDFKIDGETGVTPIITPQNSVDYKVELEDSSNKENYNNKEINNDIDLESNTRNKNERVLDKNQSHKTSEEEKISDSEEQDKYLKENSFEELELLKSMKANDVYNITPPVADIAKIEKDMTTKIDDVKLSTTKTMVVDKAMIEELNSKKTDYEFSKSYLEDKKIDNDQFIDNLDIDNEEYKETNNKSGLKNKLFSFFVDREEVNESLSNGDDSHAFNEVEENDEDYLNDKEIKYKTDVDYAENSKANELLSKMTKVDNSYKPKDKKLKLNKSKKSLPLMNRNKSLRTRIKKEEGYLKDSNLSKKKLARDLIIILLILVLIFFAYIKIISSFNLPSVEETNNKVKHSKTIGKNTDSQIENPSKISEKTTSEKENNSAEKKASSLDRKAEQYKNGKGKYYVVFIGATNNKDSAESEQNNFANKGINAKIIRNSGYYMLKSGDYLDYNKANADSVKLTNKGIQNYVVAMDKYYDLKIQAFETRIPTLSAEQLKTDYDDIKNQLLSTGKNAGYVKNLDEIYEKALKEKQ